MWQRVLGNRQINATISSKISKSSVKALFSTRNTIARGSQTRGQNHYKAFEESLNKHKITINTQHSDIISQYTRTNSSNNNNNKYKYQESATLLEDLNNR